LAVVLGATCVASAAPAGAASPADQGVTSSTIRIGIPVIDFPALQAVGVFINDGSFQDAYNALTASINAHGGIDGRKVVPEFTETNPAVASSGTTSCNTLTEDDHIFVVMLPVYPECYQVTHDTPVIDGSIPVTVPSSAAPDFNLTPPGTAYDPVQFAAFVKRGTFKGKKVGIYYGTGADQPEATEVQSTLKKLHVNVALLAGSSAPATDTVAVDQSTQTIALRFQNAGVNEVIAVGPSGATDWPRALKDTDSSYKPPWIATQEGSLGDDVGSAKGGNPYYDNVMASSPTPSAYQEWKDPAMQKCDAIVHKAFPSDAIAPPANPESPGAAATGTDTTYAAVESACQNLAILAAIADKAGKNLTVASFTKAGYSLRNVTFPGSGGPVSFGPNQPYALGPTNFVVYDTTSGSLVPAPAGH
jgi:Periplasmic binding protein